VVIAPPDPAIRDTRYSSNSITGTIPALISYLSTFSVLRIFARASDE